MQDDISGWNDWSGAFQQIPELNSPSELHGLMTGMLCVVQAPTAEQWQMVLAQLGFEPLEAAPLQLLTEEAEDLAHALADAELDYMPLLPDDEHPLAERVTALADWCSGVLLGFGLTGGAVRVDEAELLADVQRIATIAFDEDDDDEEGEISYADLVEFVRFIPMSLSTGRDKTPLHKTALLADAKPVATIQPFAADESEQPSAPFLDVVEMFQPDRPS